MKSKKCWLALLVSGSLALTLSACSGSNSSGGTSASAGGNGSGTPGASARDVPGVTLSAGDPSFSTDMNTLHEALECSEFNNPDKEPVLLVHGTFVSGPEQYEWNYLPWLQARGFDVCITTYPERGTGDMQIAAEYVAYAILKMNEITGRKVDMVGHSQGGFMPRWAIRWWPSVQDALDEYVMHAGPVRGIAIVSLDGGEMPRPAAIWQFSFEANFLAALNRDGETPGESVDYTSIYTTFDELIQPAPPAPEPTAQLEPGQSNPRVSNVWLQEVCPNNMSNHVSIGTTDGTVALLTVDALLNEGPADFERAGGLSICAEPPIADMAPDSFQAASADSFSSPPPFEFVSEEPPLRDYARQ